MSALAKAFVSPLAAEVAAGLSGPIKKLSPSYFYDDLGSALFEAITLLPEYGLTRADERILRRHSPDIALSAGPLSLVAELGSGSGRKTLHLLQSLSLQRSNIRYQPIDVSSAALAACSRALGSIAEVVPVCNDWLEGIQRVSATRLGDGPLLLLFLGSSIGNLDRAAIPAFLKELRSLLKVGDYFLLGADLVKDIDKMIAAYDDPTGITAAFNLNLLGRLNREIGAHFDLRAFSHEVRWDQRHRRIEMHLLSCRTQDVYIGALERRFSFGAGETIWTESSHKFTEAELTELALTSGFRPIRSWIDLEWPFAEVLWRVE